MSQHDNWLSQEAHDRLVAELDNLVNVERERIAKVIQEAREEGDLKENGGYHAAKDEQGRIEARIYRVEEILRNSVVGDAPKSHGVVEQGTLVTLTLNGAEQTFLLGSAEMAGDDVTVYSAESPIGEAILGAKIGDELSYNAPNGREFAVKIINVETYVG
jgi:transcription elongation factor GreA